MKDTNIPSIADFGADSAMLGKAYMHRGGYASARTELQKLSALVHTN